MFKFYALLLILAVFANGNQEVLQQFSDGNKIFSAAMYDEISKKHNDSFITSPFSIETIMALVQCGAKGKTGKEIRNALHLPNTNKQVKLIFKEILPIIGNYSAFFTLNKIYVRDSYPIKKKFKELATDTFGSFIENVDFSQSIHTTNKINTWVRKQTNDKINGIVEIDTLRNTTVAILINIMYFNGEWKKQFQKHLTKRENFYIFSTDYVQVDTMKMSDFNAYYESSELKAKFLKLFFKNNKNVEMIIVLPNAKDGLQTLEEQIEKVLVTPRFTREYTHVQIPKFKIESKIDFKSILKKLGIKKAFSKADFSGLAGQKGQIYINEILQKNYIGVDENGVEAASATAVHVHSKSLIRHFGEEKNFIADHPFLFYIKVNDVFAFIGRVTNPKSD